MPPADNIPAFTLGAVNVSPMSMAEAYATVAARGVSCTPIAVLRIVSRTGARLPVAKAHCHQAIPAGVADAASYVLQSVLTVGTAAGLGIGRPAAGKTGTSDSFDFAAFGGYTPDLAGYVSVFNPLDPVKYPMYGTGSCYRLGCPGRHVRRGRARAHLADDVRARGPGQPAAELRHGGHSPRALVDGQRAEQPGPAEEEGARPRERRSGNGGAERRRERRRPGTAAVRERRRPGNGGGPGTAAATGTVAAPACRPPPSGPPARPAGPAGGGPRRRPGRHPRGPRSAA